MKGNFHVIGFVPLLSEEENEVIFQMRQFLKEKPFLQMEVSKFLNLPNFPFKFAFVIRFKLQVKERKSFPLKIEFHGQKDYNIERFLEGYSRNLRFLNSPQPESHLTHRQVLDWREKEDIYSKLNFLKGTVQVKDLFLKIFESSERNQQYVNLFIKFFANDLKRVRLMIAGLDII